MGFLNWLFAGSPSRLSTLPASEPQSMLHPDITRPVAGPSRPAVVPLNQSAAQASAARLEQRRIERTAMRELLFQVVRESMIRVGVLSSSFKFKVLSLEQRGRTFLVMFDLSPEYAGEAQRLAEIESMITQSAKLRHDIVVQAVYWRFTDPVISKSVAVRGSVPAHPPSVPVPPVSAPQHQTSPISFDATMPMSMPMSQRRAGAPLPSVAAVVSAFPAPPDSQVGARARSAPGQGAADVTTQMARNRLLLTGYEDTEMRDPDEPPQALSATQYGELR